jgi:hypothetical protein
MFTKKSITIMLVIIGALIFFIAGLLVWKNHSAMFKNNFYGQNATTTANGSSVPLSSVEEGKKATTDLVNELKTDAGKNDSLAQVVTVKRNINGQVVEEEAVLAATGTSPISVATGEVIAKTGEVANNSVGVGDASSPTQSYNYVDPNKLSASAIKITLNSDSITPDSFTVYTGQAVSLAIINKTSFGIRTKFDDSSLAAVVFSLMPDTTQTITFNAPAKTGEYAFNSYVGSQKVDTLAGKMIVK